MKKKENRALYLNIIIIVLEIIGLIVYIKKTKTLSIEFYTIDSNILMLVASSIYTYYILQNKKIPEWLNILKHMAVLGLSITFLVVIFILAPMSKFNYGMLLFKDSMLYQHTLCPILAFISFIFFEKNTMKKDHLLYTMMFTIIYSVVIIICNILHIIKGPYQFLYIYEQPIYMSILWIVLIDGGAYLLSKGLYKIKKRQVQN